jgi:hypothetical protein
VAIPQFVWGFSEIANQITLELPAELSAEPAAESATEPAVKPAVESAAKVNETWAIYKNRKQDNWASTETEGGRDL